VRAVVWRSVALAVAVMALLVFGIWFGLAQIALTGIGWLDVVIDFASGIGVLILAWFLFPAAFSITASFYLDTVAAAVEAAHYPALPAPRHVPVAEEIATGLRFTALALAVNVLLLPVYIALLFFPPFNGIVFFGVNGYLLGREYFELAALRRLPAADVRRLWRAHRPRLITGGIVIAVLLSVPLLNLVAPIVATAFMVHLLHGLRPEASQTGSGRTGSGA
jgi:uncharacterized protein involved in cysteine biosynthesis